MSCREKLDAMLELIKQAEEQSKYYSYLSQVSKMPGHWNCYTIGNKIKDMKKAMEKAKNN